MVPNVPCLTVPSFALAELKTGDFSEIRLVEQDQITAMRRSVNALRLYIIITAPPGIWSAKSPAGAEHRDCKASATAWIVACSCASGPAVNADWAALPGASAEGRPVSLHSGETSEICTTKSLSNSRDRASGKSSSPRKGRRRDITAAKETKGKVESFTVEYDPFKNFYGNWPARFPETCAKEKSGFCAFVPVTILVGLANGPWAIVLKF